MACSQFWNKAKLCQNVTQLSLSASLLSIVYIQNVRKGHGNTYGPLLIKKKNTKMDAFCHFDFPQSKEDVAVFITLIT